MLPRFLDGLPQRRTAIHLVMGVRLVAALLLASMTALSWGAAAADPAAKLPELSVDLHSHLFMKEAMGWLFSGSHADPIEADSWDDRLASKTSPQTLEQSGIGVAVVSLLATPLFQADMRASLREQLTAVQTFVKQHPNWVIARDAEQARRALVSGKKVLVLSLEGASGVLESDEDIREFIDEGGIRIVTPLHLVDDRFGGAAALNGFQYSANPLGVVDRLLDPHCGADSVQTNPKGLTASGRRLVIELMKRGVWIDLTHATDAALDELVPLVERAGQPLLITHMSMRRHRHAERATNDATLRRVATSRGIVGLLPSDDGLTHVQVPARLCPKGCSADACARGISALSAAYSEVADVVGADAVMLGADYNGGMRHLSQSCGTGTSLDEEAGFYHVGQAKEVWQAMRKVGAPVPPLARSLERFLSTWGRVKRVTFQDQSAPLPTRDEVDGPVLELHVGAGMGTALTDPGVVLRARGAIHKDGPPQQSGEPTVYFLRSDVDLTQALSTDDTPFILAHVAGLGVQAAEHDTLARGEGLWLTAARRQPLDQSWVLGVSALRGQARTMPGILKQPGSFNFFLELGIDALGYKHIAHISDRAALDGIHFAGGIARLGASSFFEKGVRLQLDGSMEADVNLVFADSETAYQSDLDASAGASLRFIAQGVEPFFRASFLANRESQGAGWWLTTMRYRGGVMFTLF